MSLIAKGSMKSLIAKGSMKSLTAVIAQWL